jgi:hypothetical protein
MRDQRVFQQRLLPLSESRELGGQLGGCRLCVDDCRLAEQSFLDGVELLQVAIQLPMSTSELRTGLLLSYPPTLPTLPSPHA